MDDAAPVPPDDDAAPDPPRYRWLRRGVAALLIGIAALATLRLATGCYADRRLAEAERAVGATGAPFDAADLRRPDVPPADDAVPLLRRAAASVTLTRDQEREVGGSVSLRDTADPAVLDAVLRANGPALADARLARSKSGADWPIVYQRPLLKTRMPDLGPQRDLARLLRSAAVAEADRGDSAAAVERVLDLLGQARAVAAMPFAVSQGVRAGIEVDAAVAVGTFAATLEIGDPPAPIADRRPASRERVRALVARLLDESHAREAARRGIWGERAMMLDSVLDLGQNAPLLAPPIAIGAARLATRFEPLVRAFAAPDLPTARAVLPAPAPARRKAGGETDDLAERIGNVAIAYGWSLGREFRASAARRVAAAALATRCYAADHGGELPVRLGDLVPGYLPSVPLDPLRGDGGPLGYSPGPVNPRVWSVGLDGNDDGGPFHTYAPRPSDPSDEVIFLSTSPVPQQVDRSDKIVMPAMPSPRSRD